MGIAQSLLTAIANLDVRYTVFIMIGTMIIGPNYDWKGWMVVPFLVLMYHLLVMLGANITNPLMLYIGVDLDNANTILNIVYPIFAVAYAIMGWAWCRVLGSSELFPLGLKIPNIMFMPTRAVLKAGQDGSIRVETAKTPGFKPRKVERAGPSPGWLHLLATLVYFLVIGAGQVIYDHWIEIAGQEWIGWVVNLLIGIVASVLYLIFCIAWTDNYVFGYTKSYMSDMNGLDLDESTIKNISDETRMQVIWTIVPIGALHLIGNFVIGGTRLLTADVDHNWFVCIGYYAALLILLIIVYFIRRSRISGAAGRSKDDKVDDSQQDFYDQRSAVFSSSYKRINAHKNLTDRFVDQ